MIHHCIIFISDARKKGRNYDGVEEEEEQMFYARSEKIVWRLSRIYAWLEFVAPETAAARLFAVILDVYSGQSILPSTCEVLSRPYIFSLNCFFSKFNEEVEIWTYLTINEAI